MKNVTIYTSDTCTYCTQAKEYLKSKGIAFEERNIKDASYRRELMDMGFMSVPVIKIDDETILGFDKEKIDSLLGL
ncbi:Glutaredoxin-like protein, YruB-family [Clostridium sp. USBA 49]|uniref:glutaredoxin family protein n=1 Tax=Clostridium TaxID=1485 RepID=UPI00099A835C|nr:Glutaredoxin-like protein, YruB-family [Clostridium sp. USBA 49]